MYNIGKIWTSNMIQLPWFFFHQSSFRIVVLFLIICSNSSVSRTAPRISGAWTNSTHAAWPKSMLSQIYSHHGIHIVSLRRAVSAYLNHTDQLIPVNIESELLKPLCCLLPRRTQVVNQNQNIWKRGIAFFFYSLPHSLSVWHWYRTNWAILRWVPRSI